jgi:cytoskeleton protein RodZ
MDLTGWRQEKGISLSAIAEDTKINQRYLEDIEREKFRSLPGGAYALGYIRQYAQAIQYDADRLLERYRASVSELTPQTSLEPVKWPIRLWRRIRPLK